MKKLFIYKNNTEKSEIIASRVETLLSSNSFEIQKSYTTDTDLVIAIGGDGTILQVFNEIHFSKTPVLGINTGHLGFFSELDPEQIEMLPGLISEENYTLQKHRTIRTIVETESSICTLDEAVNDVLVSHWHNSLIHMQISIEGSLIESFSGDGMLISSSTGSTAYNYSLGGSIIDPRLNLLQLTPVAPANNRAYRSFTSSLLLPSDKRITIDPEDGNDTLIVIDGKEKPFYKIKRIIIELSGNEIYTVRLKDYDFWSKVKSKFL